MVDLYYNIGLVINELIEKYNLYASQNEIIKVFSKKITIKFEQEYSVSNIKFIKKFYLIYKGGYTLCIQLSWSHSRLIMKIENEQ